MSRVKRGVTSHARHRKVLRRAKGYYGRRKNTIRVAKQAVDKIGIEYESSGNGDIEQSDIFEQLTAAMNQASDNGDQRTNFKTGNTSSALKASSQVIEAEYRVGARVSGH